MNIHLPSTILGYIRAKMIVHAFMIQFDQLVDIDIKIIKKIYIQSEWRVQSLVASQILAQLPSRKGDTGIQTKLYAKC